MPSSEHWPANWMPLESDRDGHFISELRCEHPPGHILNGLPLRVIGTGDCDNVLFELLDGTGRFAAVHLTYSVETNPIWPDTKVYDDWNHFVREGDSF